MSTEPFIGQVKVFAFDFPPRFFASCAGQLLAISTNQALFSLLGTQYGGNGTTNFALPDLRGRVAIHYGQGAGLSNYSIGQAGGEENHTLIQTEMPTHNHLAVGTANVADETYPPGNTWASNGSSAGYSNAPTGVMAVGSVATAGGSQPHNNMSPFLIVNYSIALQGIFPSRN